MRLTIARKIALAVVGIVILCIGTMAWVTSSNLQRGFVAYLNEAQSKDLDQLASLLAVRYQKEGNWDWLAQRRSALRDVLDQMTPHDLVLPDLNPQAPPPRRADGPPGQDRPDPPPPVDGRPSQERADAPPFRPAGATATRAQGRAGAPLIPPDGPLGAADPRAQGRPGLPPLRPDGPPGAEDPRGQGRTGPPPKRPDGAPDQDDPRGQGRLGPPPVRPSGAPDAEDPRFQGRLAPPAIRPDGPPPRPGEGRGPGLRPAGAPDDPPALRDMNGAAAIGYGRRAPAVLPGRAAAPPARAPAAAPGRAAAPPDPAPPPPEEGPEGRPQQPPGGRDPLGFAPRLAIQDMNGRPLIGPPDFPPGIERMVLLDGKPIARMRLRPLRQSNTVDDAAATAFLREQSQDLLLLSAGLMALSILLAGLLARHLLRPVAALRDVTARIAKGQLDARAPLLSRDELAELALHVNAMAQALEAAEQQRRRMVADISHELRTPLTVIRGELEALLDGIRQADPRALESLHAEVLRLNKLVDDLHQLTLADAGDLDYQWQQVELAGLLSPILERYQVRAAKAGLELSWTLPERPISMQADQHRLTQVLINLLENSVRYTDGGGCIVVTMSSTPTQVELRIEDSAPGVPDGAHASLFERLYRVDGARTRAKGGSGLGLAIVKALVEAHGGSIIALPSKLGGVAMHLKFPRL